MLPTDNDSLSASTREHVRIPSKLGNPSTGSEKFHEDPMFERAVTANGTGPLSSISASNPDSLFDGYAATDLGNGHRLVHHHGHLVRYVPEWGFLVWSGSRWKKDDTEGMMRIAKDTIRSMIVEAAEHLKLWADDKDEIRKAKTMLKHADSSQSLGRMKAMIEAARSERGIVARPDQFDTERYLFNCENATIDLRTGAAENHAPEHSITKKAPTHYDQDAKCPVWEKFLMDIFQNQAMVDYIQRILGYSLTGETKEQCLFIFYGTGSNGKSTLINTILTILGHEYASQMNSSTITERKDGTANNDVAALQGIRLVSCMEVGGGKRLNEELVKQFTGGTDRIRARFLYQEAFEFLPQFKLIVAANHKPESRGQDHGLWRRIRLIPFTRTFKEGEKDVNLAAKLQAEASGILAWMVRGAVQWHERGLADPEAVLRATEEYKDEMNEIGEWVGLTCAYPGAYEPASSLYKSYKQWAEDRGDRSMTQTAFGRLLDDLGFGAAKKDGIRIRLGISLTPRQPVLDTIWQDRPE